MVMDQIFGGPLSFLRLDQESSCLDYIDNAKDLLPEMSMDLEDFHFDLDTLSDSLGPWIQSSDPLEACKSEPIDFEDLDITEAVRYDCMWSTASRTTAVGEVRGNNTASVGIAIPTAAANSKDHCLAGSRGNSLSHPFCENALLDEFLRLIDTPSGGGVMQPNLEDVKTEVKEELVDEEEEEEVRSRTLRFTSLDHCYISSASLLKHDQEDGGGGGGNFIDTPPESSDDEDDFTHRSTLTQRGSISRHLLHHHHHHNNNSKTNSGGRSGATSLLKKAKSCSGLAKFSFRVKLKTDSSRSVLKHHIRSPLKVSAIGYRSSSSGGSSSQAGVRRRKEASLKLKHEEAREVHNQMERQRRNELKIAFDELKASIVDIASADKVSKQMILDKAVERCQGLRSREAALRLRREKLKRSNSQLRERLRALQRCLALQPPTGC